MSFKCKIGLHSWDGCKCTECGNTRDAEHETSKDCGVCSRCGRILEDRHDWSADCEKCSKCGKTAENRHSWSKDCEKCSKCGKVRENKHLMSEGICQVCRHGTFYDESDGTKYKIIKIGDQVMMAENLARRPTKGNYWIYENKESNKVQYGFLYDWEAARAIAPGGWHLPAKAEWESLFAFLGSEGKQVFEELRAGGNSGFESLFGGERYARGAFNSLGASGHYWSDTQEENKQVSQFKLGAYTETAGFEKVDPDFGLSVRLFRNK